MNFSSYDFNQACVTLARREFPEHPIMTTPVGVSATSHFNAGRQHKNNTPTAPSQSRKSFLFFAVIIMY